MNIKQFVLQHKDNWEQLEHSIQHLHKRKRRISGKEIDQFHQLYQQAAQNLSYSQTYFPNNDVTAYLNGLVAKSHNLLYKDQVTSTRQIKDFFTMTFIKLLLEQRTAAIIAMLLFTLGAAGAFFAALEDPKNLTAILPQEILQGVDPESLGEGNQQVPASMMSASIMTNNIQVAFLAFAGGITLGLLTVYVMIYNGIIIGALAAIFWQHGKSYVFWAYILPHGVIELTAIFIAGGAGILMGYKFFVPGNYSRIYQLKVQAKRSVQLIIGTIPLFIIAGIIEGFITPANISLELKYLVAFLTLIGLILYVWIGKRKLLAKTENP